MTAGIHKTGQRISPYGEVLSKALADWDVCVFGLNGLKALELSEEEDARLMVDVGCRHGQQLGSVLEERVSFGLLVIMAGTIDLVTGVAPGMVLHNIQTLRAQCQVEHVRTVVLRHYAVALLMSAVSPSHVWSRLREDVALPTCIHLPGSHVSEAPHTWSVEFSRCVA